MFCQQEVTPNIRALLEGAAWWHMYRFSLEPDDMEYYTMLGCHLRQKSVRLCWPQISCWPGH